jgi:hypothetical protein
MEHMIGLHNTPPDYLPTQEKQYITDNLPSYLYGTELPSWFCLMRIFPFSSKN